MSVPVLTAVPTLSVDLVRAAQVGRGLLRELDETTLRDAELRYRKFLHLKAVRPGATLAPTKLIDEMWHLHMLFPVAYASDCTAILGRILDHNPGFGSTPDTYGSLLDTFDQTAELWEELYGEPYVPPGYTEVAGLHAVLMCAEKEHEKEREGGGDGGEGGDDSPAGDPQPAD